MEEDAGADGGRRAQILRAALDQFAAHGFSGATIKGIARAARLQSQALIYWYFPTKEALFQAVIEQHLPFLRDVADLTSMHERPPDEVLPSMARSYLAMAHHPTAQRLIRLLAPEVLRRQGVAEIVGPLIANRVLERLSDYLAHQVALGRLRPHDTRSSARAFFGMLIPQAASVVALPELRKNGPSDAEHVATSVAIFLRGLRPE